MTKPTKIKIDTLFDRCCKKIDDVGVPKVVSTVAYCAWSFKHLTP